MQYAERLPNPKSMVVPVVALAIGAAAATGTYALMDSEQVTLSEPKVIVSETPAPTSQGLAAKHEAATAAAIGQAPTNSFGKDEAGTAAAIARQPATVGSTGIEVNPSTGHPTSSPSTVTKDEAGTAAAVGIPSPAAAVKMNAEAGSGTASKDEAGTAAAVGNGSSEDADPFTSRTGRP
jgi:hypothetical protein